MDMEPNMHDSTESAASSFEAEGLPFPPLPPRLAQALAPRGPAWYATRDLETSPYDLEHFAAEVETQPGLPDYAVVGFDGHGINSWAAHCYLVTRPLALFIQLPWGGAYTEADPAREDIAAVFAWAAALQSRIEQADALGRIPRGVRLQVVASRFGRAGWRWIGGPRDPADTPWQPSPGMLEAMLAEVGDLVEGRSVL